MSATSGRDVILNGELASNLDGKNKKILNTDLSDASNTLPAPTLPNIPHTTKALVGDGNGAVLDSKVTLTSPATGSTLTILDGKTLTVNNILTLAGTDNSTLNVGGGGTLGTAAYTAATAYATSSQGTKADNVAAVNGIVKCNGSGTFAAATAKTDYWDTTVMVASGASHAKGLVPDPGASSGTTKFLREDGSWQVPPASAGVTIAVTTDVIKGDGAGGGIAAVDGTDYYKPTTAFTRLTASTTALSGASPTVNWNTTTSFSQTLAAETTYTFSNTTDSWDITIAITNTASNFAVHWPAGIKWQGGTAPTQTGGAVTDIWSFKKFGSIIYGSVHPNHS